MFDEIGEMSMKPPSFPQSFVNYELIFTKSEEFPEKCLWNVLIIFEKVPI